MLLNAELFYVCASYMYALWNKKNEFEENFKLCTLQRCHFKVEDV